MTPVIEQREKAILKRLRKRQAKSLSQIADEVGGEITIKHLTAAAANLVRDGRALKHKGRVPTYTKGG